MEALWEVQTRGFTFPKEVSQPVPSQGQSSLKSILLKSVSPMPPAGHGQVCASAENSP